MPEGATSVSLKCKICGGDIRNDYFAGTCVCAHCGNKWDMKDMIPDYEKHARSIELVAKAKEMLEENRGSIRAIAAQVGYDDVYHFSKLFKKYYGVSPLYYRKAAIDTE